MHGVFHNNVFQAKLSWQVFCLNLFFDIIYQPMDGFTGG